MDCVAKCGCYLWGIHIGKTINHPLKQTCEGQVHYLQSAGMFQAVVSVRGLEQNSDCIFFSKLLFLSLSHSFIHSFLSMW